MLRGITFYAIFLCVGMASAYARTPSIFECASGIRALAKNDKWGHQKGLSAAILNWKAAAKSNPEGLKEMVSQVHQAQTALKQFTSEPNKISPIEFARVLNDLLFSDSFLASLHLVLQAKKDLVDRGKLTPELIQKDPLARALFEISAEEFDQAIRLLVQKGSDELLEELLDIPNMPKEHVGFLERTFDDLKMDAELSSIQLSILTNPGGTFSAVTTGLSDSTSDFSGYARNWIKTRTAEKKLMAEILTALETNTAPQTEKGAEVTPSPDRVSTPALIVPTAPVTGAPPKPTVPEESLLLGIEGAENIGSDEAVAKSDPRLNRSGTKGGDPKAKELPESMRRAQAKEAERQARMAKAAAGVPGFKPNPGMTKRDQANAARFGRPRRSGP